MEIVVHVLSRDAVGMTEGATATVTGWGGPDLPARVTRVEPGATTRVSALGIEEQRVEVRLSLMAPPPRTLGRAITMSLHLRGVKRARSGRFLCSPESRGFL